MGSLIPRYGSGRLGPSRPMCKASLSWSVIDTVIKTGNLRIVPEECHGDDTLLTFHDTTLSSYYWYMLANLMSMTLK